MPRTKKAAARSTHQTDSSAARMTTGASEKKPNQTLKARKPKAKYGSVALREIKRLQKSTNLLLAKGPF